MILLADTANALFAAASRLRDRARLPHFDAEEVLSPRRRGGGSLEAMPRNHKEGCGIRVRRGVGA